MMALASSGSRSCASSVEPLMSANSAVTVLRSPSTTSESVCSDATRTGDVEGVRAVDFETSEVSASALQRTQRKMSHQAH
jgi:hypothetical protein